ncbi:MAG: tetratricopeptide repeat protein [Patescibacteria group bacterium]|nr:tetratricopeptide repeat protein [Patescibacteria group bacterium]
MNASNSAPSANDAINAALSQNWDEAIRINLLLLQENPDDIDAYNRLGFAYAKKGNETKAKEAYEHVLRKDPYNQIAQKNLKKLNSKHGNGFGTNFASPSMFIEEPGKTKLITCVNVAPLSVISKLCCGQEVYMKVKKHGIEIRDEEKVYLGALPDDISYKLTKYIQGGNEYKIFVRSAGKNTLTVFIKEIARGDKYKDQPSFTSSPSWTQSMNIKLESLNDRPDVNPNEDSEE